MRTYLRLFQSRIALGIVFLMLGTAAGYLVPHTNFSPNKDEVERIGGYNYINPLLSCDIQEDTPFAKYANLRTKLQKRIKDAVAKGDVVRASIYFRDMNIGNWTGVNESDSYIPASLLKLPILIAYLHDAQTNAAILDTQYMLPAKPDMNEPEYFKPEKPLTLGKTYSVSELLSAMIEQSDNNAEDVLNRHVSTSSIDNVYGDFGVPIASDEITATMSPVEYMRFFRILYNATYLYRSRSQQALEMLSKIDFPQGAVRGIPSTIPFANKFGERTVNTVDAAGTIISSKKYLADCGIVYYPGSPYGICIMTEGDDFSKMADLITDLSRIAYSEVDTGLLNQ